MKNRLILYLPVSVFFFSFRQTAKFIHGLSQTFGCCRIFTAVLLFSAFLLSAEDFRPFYIDDCDKLHPPIIRAGVLDLLQTRGLNTEEVAKTPVPQGWAIEWGSFQPEDKFSVRDNHLLIHAPQEFVLYGRYCIPDSQNYRMEISLKSPDDASFETSIIDFGVYIYGMVSPGQRVIKSVKLSKGESKTFEIPIRFDHDFAPFRAMLKITGDVQLEKCVMSIDTEQIKREKRTLLEGTLTELSAIPDPKNSDYPDCRFSAHLVGNSIINGISCPKEVNLIIEGFKNYKLLKTARLKAGDKVRLLMLPFEDLPNAEKVTQQTDDLNLFSLENYYCVGLTEIKSFHDADEFPASGIYFNDAIEYVSIFERHINPPVPDELVKAQKEAIAADLAKINAMLEPWTETKKTETNEAFTRAWEKEKAKDAEKGKDYNRVKIGNSTFVWRNLDNSFWCLPVNYTLIGKYNPVSQDKMDALVALKDFFESNGCQFIVSLVPQLYDISARVINKDFKDVPDFCTAYVAKQFLDAGIETVYGSDEIIKNYNRYPWAFFYPANGHPSDVTQDVLSDLLVAKLSRYGFTPNLEPEKFSVSQSPHVYRDSNEYLWPKNCDIGGNVPQTAYTNRQVMYNGTPLGYDENSPVLILGNSFIDTPMGYPDTIPTLISYKLNAGTYGYRISGQGPMTTIVQYLSCNPKKFLEARRVVILHTGVQYLAYNGIEYNNIRRLDQQKKALVGKKMVYSAELRGNTCSAAYQGAKDVCLLPVDKKGNSTLINLSCQECNLDKGEEITVVINGWCLSSQNVAVTVNGIKVAIPRFASASFGKNNASTVILPAGTDKIMIEISGTPGHEISITNILLFQ